MPNLQNTSQKKLYCLVGAVLLIAIITGCTFIFGNSDTSPQVQHDMQQSAPNTPREENIPKVVPFSYDILVNTWNQHAEKLSHRFVLMGNDIASNDAVCETMEKLSQAFANKNMTNLANDLDKLGEEIGQSTFFEYANFLKKHQQSGGLVLHPEMGQTDLAHALNKHARIQIKGRTPDYINPELVKTFVYMNSFCTYFNKERDKLHRKGIDTKAYDCKNLHTKGQYPTLDALIDE